MDGECPQGYISAGSSSVLGPLAGDAGGQDRGGRLEGTLREPWRPLCGHPWRWLRFLDTCSCCDYMFSPSKGVPS